MTRWLFLLLQTLTLWLRHSDGTPVVGETVFLHRLPDAPPVTCLSDEKGQCTWLVEPGLYQVQFDRPVDPETAVLLAEGGLSGLGIMVGEADVTTHVTFQGDGRVYFDRAPTAVTPVPVMPTPEQTPALTVTKTTPTLPTTPPRHPTRLLFFIIGGLLLGGGVAWWQRWRPKKGVPHA